MCCLGEEQGKRVKDIDVFKILFLLTSSLATRVMNAPCL
jgi:hypothetical protein